MQPELFHFNSTGPATEASRVAVAEPSWLDRIRITLRLDHLSIAAILALVVYVLVFSFGVEKGKRIALKELEAQKAKQDEVARELGQIAPFPAAPPAASATQMERKDLASPLAVADTSVENPAAVPEPASLVGKYTIQTITFFSRTRAEEEAKRLKEQGYRTFILVRKKTFQVCLETFDDLSHAREKLMQLKADGFVPPDAYVRPLQGPVTTI